MVTVYLKLAISSLDITVTVELESVPKRIRDRLPSVDAMGIRSLAERIETKADSATMAGLLAEKASIAGLATGAVTVAADGVETASGQSAEERLNEIVSVTRFGAVADGSTSCSAAFQLAADHLYSLGGGTAYIPQAANFYRLTYPVLMRPGVTFKGGGYGSWVHNDAEDFPTATPFQCGSFHPNVFPENSGAAATYQITATAGPVDRVTCTTASHAGNFLAGELIYLRSKTGYQRLNRVISANASTGLIILEWEIDCALEAFTVSVDPLVIVEPYVTKFAGTSFTPTAGPTIANFMGERHGLRNMRISTVAGNHFARAACLDGIFEQLWLEGGDSMIGANALTRCRFSDIRGDYCSRAIEAADGAWGTIFERIVARYISRGSDVSAEPVVLPGHKGIVRDFHIVDGAGRSSESILKSFFGEQFQRGTVVLTAGTTGRLIGCSSLANSVNINTNAVWEDIECRLTGAADITRLARFGSTTSQDPTMRRVRFTGTPTNSAGVLNELSDGLIIEDCDIPNTTISNSGTNLRLMGANKLLVTASAVDAFLAQASPPKIGRSAAANFAGLYREPAAVGAVTGAETAILSLTAAAPNVIYRGDELRVTMLLDVSGTGGTKTIQVTWGGTTNTWTILAATVGEMRLESLFKCYSDNGRNWYMSTAIHGSGLPPQNAAINNIDPATTDLTLSITVSTGGGATVTPQLVWVNPQLVGS